MEEKGQINRVFIDGTFYTLVQRVYFLLVLLFLVSATALTLSVLYEEGQSRIELQTKVPEDLAKISQPWEVLVESTYERYHISHTIKTLTMLNWQVK